MTAAQYWDDDCTLVKAYREAEKLRKKRENEKAWLHGLYFYKALCCASPVFHDLAPQGTTPIPYMEKPFTIDEDDKQENEEQELKRSADNFAAFAAVFNARFIRSKDNQSDGNQH